MQQGNMPGATIGPDQAIYDMHHFAKGIRFKYHWNHIVSGIL
jgi:hypothetical protein